MLGWLLDCRASSQAPGGPTTTALQHRAPFLGENGRLNHGSAKVDLSPPGSHLVVTTGERSPEKAGVGGSIPSLATMFSITYRPSKTQFHSGSFQNFWSAGIRLRGESGYGDGFVVRPHHSPRVARSRRRLPRYPGSHLHEKVDREEASAGDIDRRLPVARRQPGEALGGGGVPRENASASKSWQRSNCGALASTTSRTGSWTWIFGQGDDET